MEKKGKIQLALGRHRRQSSYRMVAVGGTAGPTKAPREPLFFFPSFGERNKFSRELPFRKNVFHIYREIIAPICGWARWRFRPRTTTRWRAKFICMHDFSNAHVVFCFIFSAVAFVRLGFLLSSRGHEPLYHHNHHHPQQTSNANDLEAVAECGRS